MPLDQPDENDPVYQDYDHGDPTGGGHYKLAPNDLTMPLGDHLDELRGRLIKMFIGIALALVITVIFGFQIIGWLAKPLLYALRNNGIENPPIAPDPTAGFTTVYMPVVLIAAVIIAAPWIIWQGWQFVVVGLYEHEKKAVHILAPFSTVMTALGVLFTYFILLPISLNFFLGFVNYYPEVDLTDDPPLVMKWALAPMGSSEQAGRPNDFEYDTEPTQLNILESRPQDPKEGQIWVNGEFNRVEAYLGSQIIVFPQRSTKLITPLPAMNEYVRFAIFMILAVVVAFQLPVIMLVLGWTGLFDPAVLMGLRKYALFVACALGALLTPSDPFSMIVLAVPLYLLFEFGLLLMKITFKKKMAEEAAWDEQNK